MLKAKEKKKQRYFFIKLNKNKKQTNNFHKSKQ